MGTKQIYIHPACPITTPVEDMGSGFQWRGVILLENYPCQKAASSHLGI